MQKPGGVYTTNMMSVEQQAKAGVCCNSVIWLQPIVNAVCMTEQQVVKRPAVPRKGHSKYSGSPSIAVSADFSNQMTNDKSLPLP